MKNYRIDVKELFCMMVLFELGSAILFGIGGDVKQDAWLAVLLGMIGGLILFFLYTALFRLYGHHSLITLLKNAFGKYIGWLVGWGYIIYFVYISARVLRDFSSILRFLAYEDTSYITITFGMVFCIMYASHKGLEVFAKFTLITFVFVLFSLFNIVIFHFLSGTVNLQNLQPVLEEGILPVLKASFPLTVTFPYGELIVFLMILPHVRKPSKILKSGLWAILIGGGILFLFTILNLTILGADVFSRTYSPFATAVSYINIANFVQRVESIVIIIMVLTGFVKIFLFMYAAILGCSQLFQLKEKTLIYPITAVVIISSSIIAPSQIDHIEEGLKVVPFFLHIPFQIFIPIILLMIAWIKKKKRTSFKKPFYEEKIDN